MVEFRISEFAETFVALIAPRLPRQNLKLNL